MVAFAFRQGDRWVEITGAWASMLGDHSPGWVDTASPAERQASGAVAIEDGQLEPHAHQVKLSEEVADVNGVPTRRGVFADLTLDQRKAELTAQLRTAWQVHELSGFTGPAGHVATDAQVQRRLLVALASFELERADVPVTWEVRPGQMVLTSVEQIRSVAASVFQHVASCATHARELLRKVAAAKDHASLSAIDLGAGWPP